MIQTKQREKEFIESIESIDQNSLRSLVLIGFMLYRIMQVMGKNFRFNFKYVDSKDITLSFLKNYNLIFYEGEFNQLLLFNPSSLLQEKIEKYINKIKPIFSLRGKIFDKRLDVESFFLSLGTFFLKNKKNVCSIYDKMENDDHFCLANELEESISQEEKINIGNYLKILKKNHQLCQDIVDDMCVLADFEISISSEIYDYLDYL